MMGRISSNRAELGPVMNGLLFSVTVMALSVLDAFATACQEISQLPDQNKVYFETYTFIHSDVCVRCKVTSARHSLAGV